MALSITKEKAWELLRQQKKHYLWNRSFSKWTDTDVSNLVAGINVNYGNALREKNPRTTGPYVLKETTIKTLAKNESGLRGRNLLVVTPEGDELKFTSVIKAGEATGVKLNAIYNLLNGRPAESCGYQFTKI